MVQIYLLILYVATANGQYNAEIQSNDYVIFAGDSSGATAPANLVLTSWSTTKVGIRITEKAILLEVKLFHNTHLIMQDITD